MTESRTWFTIKAKAKRETDEDADPNGNDEDEAEVLIYDEIGGWGIGAADFDRALKAIGPVSTISMRINSPGGDSFAGIAIYNMLKTHPATVKARVDGIAASAASLIAMAGDRITMPENTFMVVHEPLAFTIGPASVHRAMADDLDRVSASYANTYVSRSGQTIEAVRSLMAEDRLMNAAECKERGYCDELVESVEMRATFALDRLPEKHRATLAQFFAAAPEAPPAAISGGAGDSEADASSVPDGPAAVESVPDPAPPETPIADTTTEAAELDTPELTVNPPPPAASYGAEDIAATLDLCALAGAPASTAQRFIAAKTPVAQVRAQLLETRAKAADAAGIVPYTGEASAGNGPGPSADIVAGKRRLQSIIRCSEQEKVSMDQAAWMIDNHLWKPEQTK